MNCDLSDIDKPGDEAVAGHCAIVAALIVALHESGVLPKDNYHDALRRLWIQMPEEEAVGEAGAVIDRLLYLLRPRADVVRLPDETAEDQKVAAFRRPARAMGGFQPRLNRPIDW